MTRFTTRCWLAGLALAFCSLPVTASAQYNIGPGYDLFQTVAGTEFQGIPFIGVPLGTFNFGGSIGVQNTGNTDTIIQRQSDISVTGPGSASPSPLVLLALQLESAAPTSIMGGPVGTYFITLQPTPASSGTITVNFSGPNSGTFTSTLDVFFEINFGALNGPTVYSGDLPLVNTGDTWGNMAPPGALIIPGVNSNLMGPNGGSAGNFWPGVPLTHTEGIGTEHVVTNATPEPSQLALFGVAACFGLLRRRRPKK